MDMGDSSSLKEIGIGGALMLALLIIKETISSLLKRDGKKESADAAGDRPVSEWEQRIERVVERVMENKIEPKLTAMRSTLDDIKQAVMTLIRWKGGD